MNLIKELDNNDRMGGTGGQAYYPTLSKARVLKLISSAREELLNAFCRHTVRINDCFCEYCIKINEVMGGGKE